MDITLTLGETCMLVVVIALFILLLYCISLIRHLIPSVKSLAKVMKNVEIITDSAAKSTQSAEAVVDDVLDVTSTLVSSVKSSTGIIGLISSFTMAIRSFTNIMSEKDNNSGKAKNKDEQNECEADKEQALSDK